MPKDGEPTSVDQSIASALKNLEQLHVNRPSFRLGNGRDARTGITIEKILYAAQTVFIDHGASGMSLRKVADAADIAVGNLTYHFPNKDALISATLAERLSTFAEQHLTAFHHETEGPLDTLLNVVTFYIRDARDSHRFFCQMWGYAASSDAARVRVRELYSPIGRFVMVLVRHANPMLENKEVRRIVLQIFSLEEGYRLFIGMGPEDDIAIENAETDFRNLVRRLVMEP